MVKKVAIVLQPGMKVVVKEESFACNKKRAKIVGRTRLPQHYLRDGRIIVHRVCDGDQIAISHPEVIGMHNKPVMVHAKHFEPAPASA